MIVLDEYFINGICCHLCIKHDTQDCPVETVKNKWTHETDFCGKFESRESRDSIKQFLKKNMFRQ